MRVPGSDTEIEGVVKFEQRYTEAGPVDFDLTGLQVWRDILFKLGLVGQDADRYGGFGYGNLSQKSIPMGCVSTKEKSQRKFVITGTQTGGLAELTEQHYTEVVEFSRQDNYVVSKGPIEASSESMTHGTFYDISDAIKSVFHVHSPEIWKNAEALKLPITDEKVEYGTPAMAKEIYRIFCPHVYDMRVVVMGGHEDGVFSFGSSPQEAGIMMMNYYAKARAIEIRKAMDKRGEKSFDKI